MIDPKSFTEMLMYGTVLIETDKEEADGCATAFIFEAELRAGVATQWLVTNRHVIRGAKRGTISLHLAKGRDDFRPAGQFRPLTVTDFEKVWTHHPDDTIDLSVMHLGGLIQFWAQQGTYPYWRSVNGTLLWTQGQLEDLTTVEDVVMVGYPEGLVDMIHYYPLIRSGKTASHPAIDFQGRPDGVIDLACFPGSSGSPVFLYNPSFYFDKHKMTTIAEARGALLGVLYSGPSTTAKGQVVMPNGVKGVRTEPLRTETLNMMHLGYYVKAREIVVAIEHARTKILDRLKA